MRRTTTAEVRPDAGRATRFSASARSIGVLTAGRALGTRFGVAQDARRDDPGLTTTRNPGNVGSRGIEAHEASGLMAGLGNELVMRMAAVRRSRSPATRSHGPRASGGQQSDP
jgi:hypothetical protein